MARRKKIGLALSGGGIKGVAHIGVFKALEELGIKPDIVSGVSAGAIIGVLYAAGMPWQEIKDFVDQTKFGKAFFPGFSAKGLLKHDYLKARLKQSLPCHEFEKLETPLKIACTNLNSGAIDVFDKGQLIPAVSASSSIPVLYSPELINDQLYSDGGILMNLPATIIREHCDILIGINLIPKVELDMKQFSGMLSSLSIAARTFYLNIQNNSEPDLKVCDIIIEPDHIFDHHIFSFNKTEEIFKSGYDKTMEMKDSILEQLDMVVQ